MSGLPYLRRGWDNFDKNHIFKYRNVCDSCHASAISGNSMCYIQVVCVNIISGSSLNILAIPRYGARDLVQRHSYLVKTVVEWWDVRNKTFLAVKDSPGNPLGRSSKIV